jgi:hypothetical protein
MTIEQMKRAAERCLADPASADDAATARSLLDSIESGSTAENIAAADRWFNKPSTLLAAFMARYGESS